MTIFYIIIPNLILIINFFVLRNYPFSSDHPFHFQLINKIKFSGHKFQLSSPSHLNDEYFAYPQLFHWLVSFLPLKTYERNYQLINLSISLIDVLFFNLFIYFIQNKFGFPNIVFFYCNIIKQLIPFSYLSWNAKNIGLSARGFGILLVNIYCYLIFYFLHHDTIIVFLLLCVISFLILLSSQMGYQFFILSIPLFIFYSQNINLIFIPFFNIAFYFLLNRKVARNFFIGQFNHKRNYFMFLAKIYILKKRKSIWFDFIKIFEIYNSKGLFSAFNYARSNPLIEIFFTIPYLSYSILFFILKNEESIQNLHKDLIYFNIIGLIMFVLTSLKKTRFLGEPQRYVELVIPFIVIYFSLSFSLFHCLILCLYSTIMIIFNFWYDGGFKTDIISKKSSRDFLIDRLELYSNLDYIVISNDNHVTKYLSLLNIRSLRPSLTSFYKSELEFNKYYEGDYAIISKNTISQYLIKYNIDLIVVNKDFYVLNEIDFKFINGNHTFDRIDKIDNYLIYKLNNKATN